MRAACGMHAAEALLAFQGLVTPSGMSLLSFGPVERQAHGQRLQQHQLIALFYSECIALSVHWSYLQCLDRLIDCDCRYVAKLSLAWVSDVCCSQRLGRFAYHLA